MPTQQFRTQLDICNRALQACGARHIASLTEDSKNASEVTFVYDKLRLAELRRNPWGFAIKKAVLYPINTPLAPTTSPTSPATVTTSLPTMVLVPPTWVAGRTYAFGALVQDSEGQVWVNTQPANTGTPGTDQGWDTYFGSMCVQPWDSGAPTIAWMAGDLVFTIVGDGTTQVYKSLVSSNQADPTVASTWSATITYAQGQVVTDGSYYFTSTFSLNTGCQPGLYFIWDSTVTYAANDLVAGSDGYVYKSVAGSNLNHNPVGDGGVHWTATGNRRGYWPQWNTNTSYAKDYEVAGNDGLVYASLAAANKGNDPTTDTAHAHWAPTGRKCPWFASFSASTGNLQWAALDASITPITITYPLGAGPSDQSETRNVFMLPNGFLRRAPQDPKAGSVSYLGAPSGLGYDDWVIEDGYIVSRTKGPITLRFVADVTNVRAMDPMFAEALALRIALAVCEALTQSREKLQGIGAEYKMEISDARTVNGIEQGATEPPEDDYITTRL